jgi:hypothetical protein
MVKAVLRRGGALDIEAELGELNEARRPYPAGSPELSRLSHL